MYQFSLSGKNILVVEDEYYQARGLAETLFQHGAKVVGPFAVTSECVHLCSRSLIDAAVLDVMVGKTNSFSLADLLSREQVPFIFLTGYERAIIPTRLRNVPHYLKPFVGQDVPTAVALAIVSGRCDPTQRPAR
ncbi:response regulator [Pararhizobium sp. DWP3-4]|uniref:response regulator n=1 Tax=Pararhizobium sp. DWP3-4 TaxID=2804565 RepID=UPI003CF70D1E